MSELPNEKTIERMEELLNVASDFTRLKILYCINGEEKNVSEIMEAVGASQSLISHQLRILRKNKLVDTRKEGHKVFYRLADEHVTKLLEVVHDHVNEKGE